MEMAENSDQKAGLANLSPAEPGNVRAVKHGAHSERLIRLIAPDVSEEVEALWVGTPASSPSSRLPAPCWHANWPDCEWSANTSNPTTAGLHSPTREEY